MPRGSAPRSVVHATGQRGTRPEIVEAEMDLSFDTRRVDGAFVVEVGGEVDVSTSPRLRDELVGLVNGGATRLVVSLEGVEFIDSTGLGVLVGVLKRIRNREGTLRLVCSQAGVMRVFTITGLEKVFEIFPTLDEALAASS